MSNLSNYIETSFGASFRDFFRKIGELAEAQGSHAYIVGGFVRDLLLGEPSVDVDLMISKDSPQFFKHVHSSWDEHFPELPKPSKPIVFKRFQTGKLPFKEELFSGLDVLDFSTARKEHYSGSGAVPEISDGSLHDDLERRDFSINAMAISLSSFGEVIDHFDGIGDLEKKQIRILEPKSFYKDPARLIRAVRLMERLGFVLEESTRQEFDHAISENYISNLQEKRLRDELRKAESETCGVEVISKLKSLGLCS